MCTVQHGFVGKLLVCIISGKPRSGRTAQCAQRVRARALAGAYGLVFVSGSDKKSYADIRNVEVLSAPAETKKLVDSIKLILDKINGCICFDEFDAVAKDNECVRQILQISATMNARLFLVTQELADTVLTKLAQLAK